MSTTLPHPIMPHHIEQIHTWAQTNTLIGGSDGSEMNGEGGHAYGFTTTASLTTIIGGAAKTTPGNPIEMSSLLTEHGGIIGLLLFLRYLELTKPIQQPYSLTIFIDNAEILRRATNSPTDSLKDYEVLDYDLWSLQQHLQNALTSQLTWKKVKSHASITQQREQGLIPTALNEEMDKWANLGRSVAYTSPSTFIPSATIMAVINGEYIHGLLRPHIHFQGVSKSMEEYLMEKNNWTPELLHSIAWTPTKQALQSLPKYKQHTLIKYLHNWLRDGHQIQKYAVSPAPRDLPEPDTDSYCPHGCHNIENHDHFLSCPHPSTAIHKLAFLRSIHTTAKYYFTGFHVWRLLQHILLSLLYNNPLKSQPLLIAYAPINLQCTLSRIWHEQANIGWSHILKGRFSKQWLLAQKQSYQQYPPSVLKNHHKPTLWLNAIVSAILKGELLLWQVRCEKKKGTAYLESKTLRKQAVIKIYNRIMSTRHTWPSHYHQTLPPITTALANAPTSTLLHWIHTYQDFQTAEAPSHHEPSSHDEWIRTTLHQKKGKRQTYLLPDGFFLASYTFNLTTTSKIIIIKKLP